MQIKIHIHSDKELTLPLGHHHIQQAVVYSLLSDGDGNAALHDTGYSYGQRQYKLFTFGPLYGKHTIRDGRITYQEDFSFETRFLNSENTDNILKNIKEKGVRFGDHVYHDVEAEVEDTIIQDERIVVKMLSPICVYTTNPETKHTSFITPYQDAFSDAIIQNFARKYTAAFGKLPPQGMLFNPCKVGNKYLTRYKSLIIEAYWGIYLIAGDPFSLTFLYNTGVGAKNSQGFGMFEVIG